jgi:putative ABC transport system substrate-binding protein
LRELVGQVRRLAIIVKSDNASAASETREVEAAAGALGIEVVLLEIGQAEDIGSAFEKLKGRADALYVVIDSLVTTHANRINTLALGARLPTMHGARELAAAGGLMSYAANYEDLYRRGAVYIDKILRGAKPSPSSSRTSSIWSSISQPPRCLASLSPRRSCSAPTK